MGLLQKVIVGVIRIGNTMNQLYPLRDTAAGDTLLFAGHS